MATTIQVSGADISLYHVAARQWGDASAWLALANANGITDPMLSGPAQQLTVPDYDPTYSGGAPTQT